MARLPLEFHPDARVDALDAFDWYAERSRQAAAAFQEELRYLLKRYPFIIVYRIAADRIEIVAVAHGKRRPGYWRRRLS
jgi:plasmid stabilization system protein ParE